MIANKRKLVLSQLERAEEENRRYWERRQDGNRQEQGPGKNVDLLEADMEDELRVLMKDESATAVEGP